MKPEYVILTLNVLLCSAGMLLMRYGGKDINFSLGLRHVLMTGWLWILGMGICWLAGLCFALSLTKLDITIASSFSTPLVYVAVMLGGWFFLHEPFSMGKLCGMALVSAGLFLLARL